MSLTNVGHVTKAELAREPRMLHVLAWFDGHSRGSNPNARPMDMPRRLTADEGREWREGWREGRRERLCHDAHGFMPCPGEHWPGMMDQLLEEHMIDFRARQRATIPGVW